MFARQRHALARRDVCPGGKRMVVQHLPCHHLSSTPPVVNTSTLDPNLSSTLLRLLINNSIWKALCQTHHIFHHRSTSTTPRPSPLRSVGDSVLRRLLWHSRRGGGGSRVGHVLEVVRGEEGEVVNRERARGGRGRGSCALRVPHGRRRLPLQSRLRDPCHTVNPVKNLFPTTSLLFVCSVFLGAFFKRLLVSLLDWSKFSINFFCTGFSGHPTHLTIGVLAQAGIHPAAAPAVAILLCVDSLSAYVVQLTLRR